MEIPARHPRSGDCIIREVLPGGLRVKVVVDYPALGLRRQTECLDELVDPQTGRPISLKVPETKPATPLPKPDARPSWQQARQTLLALRLGQSTAESVSDLSVGMEDVESACRWGMGRAMTGQLSFLLFESPYGMGKSHALAHLKQLALKQTMAVGTVTLDGTGVSLCEPMSLVTGLAHAIEFPDDRKDEGLPQRLAQRAGRGLSITGGVILHELLMAIDPDCVDNPDKWELIEDFLSLDATATDLKRELGIKVPSLKARFREDRPARCSTILQEWASACTVSEMGARNGLVVLLDEADVDYARRGRLQKDMEQRTGLLRAFRSIADAPAGDGGFARLLIAMAITPGASHPDPIEEFKAELADHLKVVRLRELSAAELRELGKQVVQLYQRAYEATGKKEDRAAEVLEECLQFAGRQVEGRNPRKFIRLLLEKLDLLYA
jgi:hypothetical protein